MHPRSSLSILAAVLALGAFGASSALAQEGEGCFEECPTPAQQAPYVYATLDTMAFPDILRRGQPILCGQAADPARKRPEVNCHIEAKITIPAKAARYLGLSSRVLADGVASDHTDHFKADEDESDQGRAYFLKLPESLKSKLKAKHVRALGVTITGKASIDGAAQVNCDSGDGSGLKPSCPFDSGRKAFTWGAEDGEIVCWTVMPWWVALKTKWGARCPRPINA